MSYFLTSSRLGFREWREEDLPLARTLWGNADVTRYIGGPFDEAWIVKRLADEMASAAVLGIQYWPIFLRASGAHVGCCGLTTWPYSKVDGAIQLGVHLRPEYWKQGLAEEASEAAIAWAFEVRQAPILMAGHHPDNLASRHLLTRLGFHYVEDVFYPPTGLMHPSWRLDRPDDPAT